MIRWSFLVPRLVIVGLVWAFFAFMFDPLVKRGLEAVGSKALGARLDIGALDIDFFPPRLELGDVAAADAEEPMRNLVEFRSARFDLEGKPLLERRFVISEAALEGLAFGTKRRRSGALRLTPASPASKALDQWSEQAKGAFTGAGEKAKDDVAAKYKVDPEELASVKKAQELEARWKSSSESWKGRVASFDMQGRTKELEALLEKAKAGDPLERAAAAAELTKKASALRREAEELRAGLQSEMESAKADFAAVERAKEEDLRRAASLLQLPSFDAQTLTAYLVGPRAADWAARAARWASAAKASKKPESPAPRGVDVAFPKARAVPKVWLKRAVLSGVLDMGGPLEFNGEATDWSTEPRLVERPALLNLAGAQGGRSMSAALSMDQRKEPGTAGLEAALSGAAFAAQSLGQGDVLVEAGGGTADLSTKLSLEGSALRGNFSVKALPSSLTAKAEGLPSVAARALQEALGALKTVEVSGAVSGTPEEPALSLTSNLGRAAADGLKRALGKEAEERLAGVRAKIDAAVTEKVGPLRQRMDSQAKEILGPLGGERLKELQDRIARELKVPVPGGLERLFKRP